MLIESIAIEGLGRFRESIALGPLHPGLNILAQPNEWGKSTVVHALCRALFDKYGSQSEEIRQLRPAGTTLSPRIELRFAAKGDRFRLTKRFLDGRMSELQRWDGRAYTRTDEGDKSDQRVRELLGAPLLESRKNHPETWGLIRYLWCRQDEPAEWPCWEGDCGKTARAKLATVEIDALLGALRARFECRAEEQFTPQGRIKKGSELQVAESAAQEAEAELQALRQRRADLEGLERQRAALVADLPRLERERTARALEAAALQQEAEAAEKLTGEIALAESEWKRAEHALQMLSADRDTLVRIEAELAAERAAQVRGEEAAGEYETALCQAQERERGARRRLEEQQQTRATTQQGLQRVRALEQARTHAAEVEALRELQARVTAGTARVAVQEQRLAQLPATTSTELKKGRELERKLGELRARLSAAGLLVELHPLAPATLQHAADGVRVPVQQVNPHAPAELRAARALDLELGGWGRINITSGAAETTQLQEEIATAETKWAAWLQKAGAGTLAVVESLAEEAQRVGAQLEVERGALAAHLAHWRSPLALEAALAQAQRGLDQARAEHQFTAQEEARTTVSWQTEAATLLAAEQRAQQAEQALAGEVQASREAVDAARTRATGAAQQRAGAAGRARAQEEQRAAILARYPVGLQPTLQEGQMLFTRAEARLVTLRHELPPLAEKLPERALRAARAAAEVEGACLTQQREGERLRILLEERGGEELYAKEEDALARLESARSRAEELRRAGLAARLLGQLIQRREQQSIRAVLHPLEERLTHAFAALTGEPGRRVWFDEHLAVKGVGAREDELVRFEDLSRGAREQLLLALRAAIALEVTETEGTQCLVLDDVLVHTDARRHENVLDYLQELSAKVQILLLTCHAERYRGLGQVVPVRHGRVES